jgi:cell division protein FtsW
MVYSASMVTALESDLPASDYLTSQLMFVGVGVVIALFLSRINYRFWVGNFIVVIWVIAVLLLIAVATVGVSNYGAQRWLSIGPLSVQPSEFCKIAFLLVAVRILSDYQGGIITQKMALCLVLIAILLPIFFMYETQSDLGTTVICFVGIFAVMWLGGVPGKWLAAVIGVAIVLGIVAIFGTGYRSDRLVFLNPWNDGNDGYGTGYNIIRSYYAIAEGGIFGVGLGNSHEKFQYLFASESDFIFAVISEELGLIGALLIIAAFFGILVAGLKIADRAPDSLGRMIAGGCAVMLVFQAFVNIACTIGVFPTTGKPLPFISAGGTSMLASFILLGLILAVSRDPGELSVHEQRRADLRLVRPNAAGASDGGSSRGLTGGSGFIGGRASVSTRATERSRASASTRSSTASRSSVSSRNSTSARSSVASRNSTSARSSVASRNSTSARSSISGRASSKSRTTLQGRNSASSSRSQSRERTVARSRSSRR